MVKVSRLQTSGAPLTILAVAAEVGLLPLPARVSCNNKLNRTRTTPFLSYRILEQYPLRVFDDHVDHRVTPRAVDVLAIGINTSVKDAARYVEAGSFFSLAFYL